MKIENVTEGACASCGKTASKKLDRELFCSHCADNRLIKQIGKCIKAVEHAKISIKILPKATVLKEASRKKEKRK